jgi:hypothetical protein
VDKSIEKLICVLHVTPRICSLIYERRRHGRKDGRLGAEPDQLITTSRPGGNWAALFMREREDASLRRF